jgi:hypothetical protein
MMRAMKPYTISIFQYQKKQLEENGLLEHLFGERILILRSNVYHESYGLGAIMEPKVEEFIF